MMIKRVVDFVTQRPQHLARIETSRMELDEQSTPAFERVLQELRKLSRMSQQMRQQKPPPQH